MQKKICSVRRKSKSKSKRRINKKRNTRKYIRRNSKGGQEPDKVNCCMCGKEIRKEDGLVPVKCLTKNGAVRAHRICKECWWDPDSGFAKEGVSHACPGCMKGLPLNGPPITSDIVDLTED